MTSSTVGLDENYMLEYVHCAHLPVNFLLVGY
jgi:hypothetical protein